MRFFWIATHKRPTKYIIKWNNYSHEYLKPRAMYLYWRKWEYTSTISYNDFLFFGYYIRVLNKP